MNKELLYQERPLSAAVAPEIVEPDEEFLIEQTFIDHCLANNPSEAVEDVSSEVHETNRIPDPRILMVDGNNILRLDGVRVDDSIEKKSYLGKLEYKAFEEIKKWAGKNGSGVEIWFSPPFGTTYPVAKIDIGEIRYSSDGETKVLLKKAILLDINPEELLNISNNFTFAIGYDKNVSTEELRSHPVFCTRNEMKMLLSSISEFTNQIEMITKGEDLYKKTENYQKLASIHQEIYVSSNHYYHNDYYYLRERVEQKKMMGRNSLSCPSASKTAFQSFSGKNRGSMEDQHGSLEFSCPHCGLVNTRPFGQLISNCQHCGKDVRC